MCKCKRTKNLVTAKTVLQYRVVKATKGNMNGLEAKAKTTNHYKVYTT